MYKEIHLYSNDAYDQSLPTFSVKGNPFVSKFKINQVILPLAFTSTDASNNAVVFNRNGSTKTAVVPPGNYNSSTFPQTLQDALNNVSTVKDFSVSYDGTGNLLTITAGSSFTVENFQSGTTAYAQLGMGKYDSPRTGTSVSFGVPDFTNAAPILLTSTNLVSKDVTYCGYDNINVLAMIDTNGPQNSVVTWKNLEGRWLECGTEISTLGFRLLNARTLLPVQLSQPYAVSIGILTDAEDTVTY